MSVSFKISKKDGLLSIFAVVTVSFKISYKHGALWESPHYLDFGEKCSKTAIFTEVMSAQAMDL